VAANPTKKNLPLPKGRFFAFRNQEKRKTGRKRLKRKAPVLYSTRASLIIESIFY